MTNPYSAKSGHTRTELLQLGALYTVNLQTQSGTIPLGVAFGRGPKGETAGPSTDPNNQLSTGTDGGIFMGDPALATAQW